MEYPAETRKDDCDPVRTTFIVHPQRQNTITAAPPTPHTGRLNIYTRPRNAKAILNGSTPIDVAELQTLPVGTYQLGFSHKGYVGTDREFTITHNKTTTDTVTLGGITALAGVVYKNIDLQVSYTFGLSKSDDVRWYSNDGNDTYLSSVSYKRSTFAVKLGYQIALTERLGITPQVGYENEKLTGKVEDGTNLYGDKASANCISLGAKLLWAPIKHIHVFANPAYSIGMSKDENFKKIADNSDISAGGFMVSLGAIFNF